MEKNNSRLIKSRTLDDILLDSSINKIIDECLEGECEDLSVMDDLDTYNFSKDGEILFHISDDEMEVVASFYPAMGTGKKLTDSAIINKLININIKETFIDFNRISQHLSEANESGKTVENIVIAKGIDSVPRSPSYIKLILDPEKYIIGINDLIKKNKLQNIDYKSFSQICILEKGTPVAHRVPETPGKNGMNLYGKIIPYHTKKVDKVKLGKNLKEDSVGDIIVTVDGEFIFREDEIYINEVLRLKEGVNFKTGHIHFPGSVIIHGEVEDDFNIKAEKNLYSYNTLAASKVFCGGNLVVLNGGIIGRRKSSVIVKGNVKAIHTETVNIEADKSIYIDKCTFKSNIFTNEDMRFGSRGKIIGGVIYAKNGLHVFEIGNEAFVETMIYCGVDFKDNNKLFLIKKYREELISEKQKQLSRNDSDILKKLDRQILKCDLSLEHILKNMKYNEDAQIIINGKIYPGTVINICHVKYKVPEVNENGYFYLNKELGEIQFVSNFGL